MLASAYEAALSLIQARRTAVEALAERLRDAGEL